MAILNVGDGGFATIQAAIDAATAGDTIIVAAGTYTENVSLNKAVTLLGANAGIAGAGSRGAEAEIVGSVVISAEASFDGFRILNTSANGVAFFGLSVTGAFDATIANTVFFSAGVNGQTGVGEDRAINLDTTVSGNITITGNAFTGASAANFSTASWARGIWSDGTAASLTIENNRFDFVRTALNLDGYDNDRVAVRQNDFANAGSAISVGVNAAGETVFFTNVTNNSFGNAGTDFNLQNVGSSNPIVLDLGATGNVTASGQPFSVLGGAAGDVLTGGEGVDILQGNAGADTLGGGGNADLLAGGAGNDLLVGGSGSDTLIGGADIDTAAFGSVIAATAITTTATDSDPFTAGTQAGWSIANGLDTDVVTGVERLVTSGATYLLVGNGGYATIQAAIDAASAGDTILIAAGSYAENVTINKAVTLLGANAGVAGTGVRGAESSVLGNFTVASNGVTIDGLGFNGGASAIRGEAGANAYDNLTIVNNLIANTTDSAIRFGLGSGGGIGSENWTISGNKIDAINGNNLTGIVLFNITGLTVTGNSVNHNSATATGRRGINLDGVENAVISGNSIDMGLVAPTDAAAASAATPWAIQLSMSDRALSNVDVAGNTITGAATGIVGLSQRSMNDVDITGNSISDVINGVVLNGGSTPPQVAGVTFDTDVTGNTITAAVNAIFVRDLHDAAPNGPVVFAGLDVTDNIINAGLVLIGRAETFVPAGATGPGNGLINITGTTTIDGSAGADTLQVEGSGTVVLDAGAGNDRAFGGNGDDSLDGGSGSDTLVGGAGTDTAQFGAVIAATAITTTATDSDPFTAGTQAGWSIANGLDTDVVTGVERLVTSGATYLLVGNGGYATIQAAIDAAASGDTILIAAGTYTEQLTIAGKTGLSLIGAAQGVVVKAPSVIAVNGVSAYFGDNVRAVIGVSDSSVTIGNLAVDGSFAGDTTPGSNGDEITGIALLNSSGTIANTNIFNVSNNPGGGLFGLQHGSGLFIDGSGGTGAAPAVTVTGTSISNFQKTGALIWGVALDFNNNSISGIGATDLTAQNGIQVGGSSGSVASNVVLGLGYTLGTFSSSGIIAYEPTGAFGITGNFFNGAGGSFVGIDLSDTGDIAVSVASNSVADADFGIFAYSFAGGSLGLGTAPTGLDTNDFENIAVANIFVDPELSFGAPFVTSNPFVFRGSEGTDVLAGSNGNDALDGGEGDDDLTGRVGADTLTGGRGNDTLDGGSGDDLLITGRGDDVLIGGDDIDTAQFERDWASYSIAATTEGFTISQLQQGFDSVSGVEFFTFANGTLAAADLLNVGPTDLALDGFTIAENTTEGTVVGRLLAFDPNSLDMLSFSLDDDDGGRFSVDSDGTLRVTAPLDREVGGVRLITARVTDAVGASMSRQFEIGVTDVDEFDVSAVTDADTAPTVVNERAVNGTVVGLTALAIDGDATNSSVVYRLFGDAEGRFAIDADTGVVTVADGSRLNADLATSHVITVEATSADGSTSLADFTIAVANVVDTRVYLGTAGADTFTAPADDNWTVDGRGGNDVLTTRGGADLIIAGAGSDVIDTGGGDDLITFSGSSALNGFDTVHGGSGFDEIRALATGTVISLTALSGIELITGATGNSSVVILGSGTANLLDFSGATLVRIGAIRGGGGNDTIIGSAGNDTINGETGVDSVAGGGGDDTFLVNGNVALDRFDGGADTDTIRATAANTRIDGSSFVNIEAISGGGFANVGIYGTNAANTINLAGVALTGIAVIDGGSGNDTITGSAGNDTIRGGIDADVLTGGAGADVFLYAAIGDSRPGFGDTITDFSVGSDVIDLGAIDANQHIAGNNAFTFIGGSAFSNTAGELRIDTSIAGQVRLLGDIGGDGREDIIIVLTGAVALTAADIIL